MDRKKGCYYCTNKIDVDFQNVKLLNRFLTFDGKIESRSRTKLCARHQKLVSRAIKTGRQMGMIR